MRISPDLIFAAPLADQWWLNAKLQTAGLNLSLDQAFLTSASSAAKPSCNALYCRILDASSIKPSKHPCASNALSLSRSENRIDGLKATDSANRSEETPPKTLLETNIFAKERYQFHLPLSLQSKPQGLRFCLHVQESKIENRCFCSPRDCLPLPTIPPLVSKPST